MLFKSCVPVWYICKEAASQVTFRQKKQDQVQAGRPQNGDLARIETNAIIA